MENASKALIIAGAILLSILIIALGIYVFNMAKSATDTNQLDTAAKNTFNAQFEQYEGRQVGSSVKSLLSYMINNAGTNADSEDKLPDIEYVAGGSEAARNYTNITSSVGNTGTSDMSGLRSALSATHYYNVSIDYASDGLVNKVTISYN